MSLTRHAICITGGTHGHLHHHFHRLRARRGALRLLSTHRARLTDRTGYCCYSCVARLRKARVRCSLHPHIRRVTWWRTRANRTWIPTWLNASELVRIIRAWRIGHPLALSAPADCLHCSERLQGTERTRDDSSCAAADQLRGSRGVSRGRRGSFESQPGVAVDGAASHAVPFPHHNKVRLPARQLAPRRCSPAANACLWRSC